MFSTKLSEMESKVVEAVCDGGTNKLIAANLDISINTLKTHLQHIYKKLDIHSKTDLVLKYYKEMN